MENTIRISGREKQVLRMLLSEQKFEKANVKITKTKHYDNNKNYPRS